MSRALRALSSAYVERRSAIVAGAPLAGRGKRAAFALFYGPLHFLLVDHIVRSLGVQQVTTLVDLGCGTGSSGAAWAAACARTPPVIAIDRNSWALAEAADTYRRFAVPAKMHRDDVATVRLPKQPSAILAAFTLNEVADAVREEVLERLLAGAARPGAMVLIVEPLAKGIARWWDRWSDRVSAAGGRSDEWRVRTPLPAIVAKLDRAAGLDHREITGRSLFLSSSRGAARAASS